MDNFPEIDRILNTSRMRSHLNSLILNENISTSCKYKKKIYILSNTCPFDATLVGICVAYIDYETFRIYVDNSKNEILGMAKDIALNGSSTVTYHKRLELIMQHFEVQSSIPTIKYINAECNVSKIIYDFFKTDPSAIQYTSCTKNCNKEEKTQPSPTLIFKKNKGFSNFKNMILEYTKIKITHCQNLSCTGLLQTYRVLGNTIFIEADKISHKDGYKIDDFPETIEIEKSR